LRDLARTILAPYQTQGGATVNINGPDVPVAGKAAMGLALLLHEMATNAAKYGALTLETGHVDVSWRVMGEALEFEWREPGGPAIDRRPDHEGFAVRRSRAASRRANRSYWLMPAPVEPSSGDAAPAAILVVEPDILVRMVIADYLRDCG